MPSLPSTGRGKGRGGAGRGRSRGGLEQQPFQQLWVARARPQLTLARHLPMRCSCADSHVAQPVS
eukprot:5948854-Pleurochrysis_carterae.AAC.1